ncbi:MAG: flagellar basal body P-ring formation protein FlgA [Planctomycetes bacterium]|nr:flagellar basal body P-ring formation protein FlgA [Planctomycetota bacterium]
MNSKKLCIILIGSLFVSAISAAEKAGKDPLLRIYLPRKVTVADNTPKLGEVGIIHGSDELVVTASAISLGKISMKDQKLIVDRRLILSRLASNGIAASDVMLTGAHKVAIRQDYKSIGKPELIEVARAFLKKNFTDNSVCQFNPLGSPEEFIMLGGVGDLRFSPRLATSGIRNQVKVQIVIFGDGQQIGVREVTFKLKYNCRRAVALVDIARGAVISKENVKIEEALSNYPESANWSPPYGLIARRRLSTNMVIHASMVGPVKPHILLKRNQSVVIRIDRGGLFVTVRGVSMQPGSAGEYIKIRNVDSQRIIMAKVNEDGTVEPVF